MAWASRLGGAMSGADWPGVYRIGRDRRGLGIEVSAGRGKAWKGTAAPGEERSGAERRGEGV